MTNKCPICNKEVKGIPGHYKTTHPEYYILGKSTSKYMEKPKEKSEEKPKKAPKKSTKPRKVKIKAQYSDVIPKGSAPRGTRAIRTGQKVEKAFAGIEFASMVRSKGGNARAKGLRYATPEYEAHKRAINKEKTQTRLKRGNKLTGADKQELLKKLAAMEDK